MRAVILAAAAVFAVLAPDAFAQTETPKRTETPKGYMGAYAAGTPPTPYSTGSTAAGRQRQSRLGRGSA